MLDNLFTPASVSSHPPTRRERLRAEASSLCLRAAIRLSPAETRRFIDAANEQANPEPTTIELLNALITGGIPAVIDRLS